MSIALYAMAAWFAAGTLMVIGSIGKPRKPLTSAAAVMATLIGATEVVLLVLAAARLW